MTCLKSLSRKASEAQLKLSVLLLGLGLFLLNSSKSWKDTWTDHNSDNKNKYVGLNPNIAILYVHAFQ